MAETFEAVRLGAGGFEQRVCLKRILPVYRDDQAFVARFHREARLAAQLRHSNIVGITDFGDIDGVSYMALELVDGVDLRSFLKTVPEHRLSAEIVALLGLDLSYALAHAHGSIIHRDVTPSNVLISRTGDVKLADFGIAKAVGAATVTATKGVHGKIPYMSPEHMSGAETDARSDLFSLGVVMFEAASGVRPFDGANDVDTMRRIVEGERLSLNEVAPEVPAPLCLVIEHLLEPNADARIPTAAALVEALEPIAPSPQTRRDLARRVEALRGGPQTRMHVRARDEEPDTELSPAPATSIPRAPNKSHAPRWVGFALGAAALFAMLAVGVNLARKPAPASSIEQVLEPAAKPSEASDAAELGADRAPKTEESAEPVASGAIANSPERPDPRPARDAPIRARRGSLYVVVHPWGNVWVDGVWMGRAPVEARVAKGRHVVEVGRDIPASKRVVRVEAGVRREVEFSLDE